MRERTLLALSLGTLVALLASIGPARPQSTAPASSRGVKLTFYPSDDGAAGVDARVARLFAIAVPEGVTASPALAPGPFRATFEGDINLKIRGDYTFVAHGAGTCEVVVNGQSILTTSGDDLAAESSDKVRLKKGPNRIVVRYASPAMGRAALRLYWAERTNPAEPIPPTVLTHDPADTELNEHRVPRAGRELMAQLHCAKCHTVDSGLPEVAAEAPSLEGVGSRLRAEWVARWVADPHALRREPSMPRVLPRDDPRAPADVAAYLATLKRGEPSDEPFAEADVAPGARLYVDLGCVACHAFEDGQRYSLADVREKFFSGSLLGYLRQPHAHYAWNPMPDFKLSDDEARRLAAYLWSRARPPAAPVGRIGDPARGKELFSSAGCANCHVIGMERREEPARTAIAGAVGGCLADDETRPPAAPDFGFSVPRRRALTAAVRAGPAPARDTPADFAERQVRALNCAACHAIDAQPDTWSGLKPEIESIQGTDAREDLVGDQSRPTLTWAGEKLHAGWMAKFIAGQVEEKPRPWLASRMPSFGAARAQLLAEGLAQQHGILSSAEAPPPIDEEAAEIGRRLVGKENGFSCVTCHAIGSTPATSPFEAHGPNFVHTAGRMRHDFYTRWVRSPQRYEPGTRMPQYADLEGKTSFRDVYDGDAARQFEAIWQYLCKGEKMEPPK